MASVISSYLIDHGLDAVAALNAAAGVVLGESFRREEFIPSAPLADVVPPALRFPLPPLPVLPETHVPFPSLRILNHGSVLLLGYSFLVTSASGRRGNDHAGAGLTDDLEARVRLNLRLDLCARHVSHGRGRCGMLLAFGGRLLCGLMRNDLAKITSTFWV
jgi:hypothetical protein